MNTKEELEIVDYIEKENPESVPEVSYEDAEDKVCCNR